MYVERRKFKKAEPEELGYRRKFNALHWYIVDNFGGGNDACDPISLTKENVEQIITTLKAVLAKPTKANAKKLLPPHEWFFFGGTEYDEYYFEDCKSALDIFEEILMEYEDDRGDIYYQASW